MNKTADLSISSPTPSNDKVLAALLIAIIIHTGVILGINFSATTPEKTNKVISITLVNKRSEKAPEKANFLVQENQIKAGEKKPNATPPALKPHGMIDPNKPKQAQANKPKQSRKQAPKKEKLISPRKAPVKTSAVVKASPSKPNKTTQLLTPSMLSQQIAQIGIRVMDKQLNAENSRIKSVDAVNVHKFQTAIYIQQWQTKVERVGNLNYPSLARKHGFTGKLLLDVGIKYDGSIYEIRVRKSSGFKALDDAAIKIVRLGAPYAPLPPELLKELDVLIISRIWQFSNETR